MLIKKSNNKKHIDIETLKKILLKTSITYFWTDGSPVESTEKEIPQTFYQVYSSKKIHDWNDRELFTFHV